MSRTTPTWQSVILAAVEEGLGTVCTAIPASVESYDAATQKCSAQPLIQRITVDEEGERVAERLPVIPDVPVQFPSAGRWRLTFPIAKGDTVWLVFAQASLDRWLARGGEVDPEDARHHHLSDAVAIPGGRDFAHAIAGVSGSSMVLGNADVQVEITDTEVRAGGSDALALLSDLDLFMATLTATATAITGTNPTGGAALASLYSALVSAGFPVGTLVTKGS